MKKGFERFDDATEEQLYDVFIRYFDLTLLRAQECGYDLTGEDDMYRPEQAKAILALMYACTTLEVLRKKFGVSSAGLAFALSQKKYCPNAESVNALAQALEKDPAKGDFKTSRERVMDVVKLLCHQ